MKNDKITEGVIKPLESPMGMQLQVNVFSLRVLRTQTLIWRCNIFSIDVHSPFFLFLLYFPLVDENKVAQKHIKDKIFY